MIKKYIAEFKDPKSLMAFFSNKINRKKGIHYYFNGDLRDIVVNKKMVNCYPAVDNQFDKVVLKDEAGEMLTPEQAIPGQAFYTLSYCYGKREFHVLVSDADSPDSAISNLMHCLYNEVQFDSENDYSELAAAIRETLNGTCDAESSEQYAMYLLSAEQDNGIKRGGEGRFYIPKRGTIEESNNSTRLPNTSEGEQSSANVGSKKLSDDELWAKFMTMNDAAKKSIFAKLIESANPEVIDTFSVSFSLVVKDVEENDRSKGCLLQISYTSGDKSESGGKSEYQYLEEYITTAAKSSRKFILALVTCLGADGNMTGKHRGIDFGYSSFWIDLQSCLFWAYVKQGGLDWDGIGDEKHANEDEYAELGEFSELKENWDRKFSKLSEKSGPIVGVVNRLAESEEILDYYASFLVEYNTEALTSSLSKKLESGDNLFWELVRELLLQSNNRRVLYDVYSYFYADQTKAEKKNARNLLSEELKELEREKDPDQRTLEDIKNKRKEITHLDRACDYEFFFYLMRLAAEYTEFEYTLYKFFQSGGIVTDLKDNAKREIQPLSKTKGEYNEILMVGVNTTPIELAQVELPNERCTKFYEQGVYSNLRFFGKSYFAPELKKLVGKESAEGNGQSKWTSLLVPMFEELEWFKEFELRKAKKKEEERKKKKEKEKERKKKKQ